MPGDIPVIKWQTVLEILGFVWAQIKKLQILLLCAFMYILGGNNPET